MQLSKFISKLIFFIALISALLVFSISIIFQYNNYENDKEYIKNEFIEIKKNEIKKEVIRVYNLIEHKIKRNDKATYELQQELLDWISTIRFENNGYIFINTTDKKALIFDGKKLNSPITYPNDFLYKQQLDAIKNKNGDFFFYKFKKLNEEKKYEKIAFVISFEKWGWIIGSGVYLDELENEIKRKEAVFKETISNEIKFFLYIFILILIGIYITSKKISDYININIKNLIYAFKKASEDNRKIDTKDLTYTEFISLANNLNIALASKNKIEEKLQDYIKIVNNNVIISTTDAKGNIIDASEAFCNISGYSKNELIGKSHNIVRHEDMPQKIYQEMWDNLNHGLSWKGEIKNKNKNGNDYWVDAIIQPIFQDKQLVGFTAIRQDITDKKTIEHLSITDELTDVYNRRYFNRVIEEELNRSKRSDIYISFMMIDIDYFKKYNDTYGHQEGDITLKKVATALKSNSRRSGDFVFRLGGEEFAMIFSNEDKIKSYEFANNLIKIIENLQIEHKNSNVNKHLTISIGLVTKKANEFSSSSELYKEADEALYLAKNRGRNQIFMAN